MKIENLRSERNDKRVRVAATVTWEDCDRPTDDVYFEGVPEKTRVFTVPDVHEALRLQKQLNPYFLEMLPYLKARGFDDLAKDIEKKIAVFRKGKMIAFMRELTGAISAQALSMLRRNDGDLRGAAERTP